MSASNLFSSQMTSSALLIVCRHQQRSHNKRGLTSVSSSLSDLSGALKWLMATFDIKKQAL